MASKEKRWRKQRLKAMRKCGLWPKPRYHKYIASRFWRTLSKRFLHDAGYRCECCGCGGELHVHHKTYKSLGNESRHQVQVLCRDCHSAMHEADGVELTDEISAEYRAIIA